MRAAGRPGGPALAAARAAAGPGAQGRRRGPRCPAGVSFAGRSARGEARLREGDGRARAPVPHEPLLVLPDRGQRGEGGPGRPGEAQGALLRRGAAGRPGLQALARHK